MNTWKRILIQFYLTQSMFDKITRKDAINNAVRKCSMNRIKCSISNKMYAEIL